LISTKKTTIDLIKLFMCKSPPEQNVTMKLTKSENHHCSEHYKKTYR